MSNLFIQAYYQAKYKLYKDKYGSIYKTAGISYKNEEEMAEIIKTCLINKKPYLVGKIGGNEENAVVSELIGTQKQKKHAYDRLCFFAGFFPNDFSEERLKEYVKIQTNAISELDMVVYYEKVYESYLMNRYPVGNRVWVDVVGSWSQEIHWTRELEGYKVVVVHPFAELIKSQYEKRESIYLNSDVLPQFDLRVVKAIQSIGDNNDVRFDSWFEALEYMYQEIVSEDFDIALIGAGAYGLPLAAMVKSYGKIGVHMGGDLQMLFGIKGKRWDERADATRWYNDAWVRPSDEYKVKGFSEVENGCYW